MNEVRDTYFSYEVTKYFFPVVSVVMEYLQKEILRMVCVKTYTPE